MSKSRLTARSFIIVAALSAGCASGAQEAEQDIRRDHLELRSYGFGGSLQYKLLEILYGVEYKRVAGCVVSERLARETDAYNDVMLAEIASRFGTDTLERLKLEANRLLQMRLAATGPAK